jgi:CHAT domain-containing protein
MQRAELAARLVESSNAERDALLRHHSALADVELAYALKEICYDAFTVEPSRSIQAAAALTSLANKNNSQVIQALADWANAIAALIQGQMEPAISHLDSAERQFLALDQELEAATTQLSKLIALAMLGHYDEAIECGLRARAVFLAHNDLLSAGRIENNIGNLYFRRERYNEAEEFQRLAREKFIELRVDLKQLAIINNCLANTHAVLHKFKSAEELYQQAEQQAKAAGLPVTLAEIEGNIGNFALLQGRYDRALDYLERARRRYVSLDMPHQSTIAEQEIADAYLELNLPREAATIYERIIPRFAELGLRAEQARALAYLGRAALLESRSDEAHNWFIEARLLYEAEGNEVGAAMVALSQSQLEYSQGDAVAAGITAAQVEPTLAQSGSWRRLLLARWLRGEATRAQGALTEAASILSQTLHEAELNEQPRIAELCHTSLGLLAVTSGAAERAEQEFSSAINLTEELRAPLPGDEFRTAFFSDKLLPYNELVKLCLADGASRVSEAFLYVERARARALVDAVAGNSFSRVVKDPFEVALVAELEDLRPELNYFYNQLNRPAQLGRQEIEQLQAGLRERERKASEIARQLQHRQGAAVTSATKLDLAELQLGLGIDTVLLEYTTLGDELLAFIVSSDDIEVVRELGSEEAVTAEITQLRFQIDALRHGSAAMRRHLPDLTQRAQRHVQKLYDLLIRPLEKWIHGRRLVIVPQRALHYLPFQALHDGERYLLERCEVSYAPSAVVLQQCLRRAKGVVAKALLLGVADERIPRVADEIRVLTPLFPNSRALLNENATLAELRGEAPNADVIHIACHGQFRPDNPLFSSLRLGDGWLTVRDAYDLNLNCELVTLSACETGVNTISPGEELIGLARGFFAAGAPSILMSLWTIDDEATAALMVSFYQSFEKSGSASQALREAQLTMMSRQPHPFFWSPFVLIGRW